MAKHAKKAHHEEEMGEAWLLPYSDLMTLLLAVFIVLYAVNKVDDIPPKAAALAESFRNMGILTGEASIMGGVGGPASNTLPDPDAPLIDIWSQFPQVPSSGDDEVSEQEKQMENFKEALKTYFAQNNMSENFTISDKPSMITLSLASDVLFPLGSAILNDAQKEVARNLAKIIYETQQNGLRFQVQVSGHTDNLPIQTTQYASNWNLSLDRASHFLAAMIDGSQLDPRSFTAVGHGEMDPVDTNDTPEGRQNNRRVEVQFLFEENVIGNFGELLRPGGPEENN